MSVRAAAVVVALLALASTHLLSAQDASGPAAGAPGGPAAGGSTGGAADHTPEPYAPGELPGWVSDLWRAEAVFVGSFPMTLFLTLEVYDTYRYATRDFSPRYAPWPLGSGAAAGYDSTETLWLTVSALSLSVAISGIDFLLGTLNDRTPGN